MPPDPLASSRVCLASVSRPFIISTTQTTSKTSSPSDEGAPPPPPALEGHEITRSLVFSRSDALSQTGARDGQAGGLGQGISRRDTIRVQRHHFGCCISDRRGGKDCRKKASSVFGWLLNHGPGRGDGRNGLIGRQVQGEKEDNTRSGEGKEETTGDTDALFSPGFLHEAGAEGGSGRYGRRRLVFLLGGLNLYVREGAGVTGGGYINLGFPSWRGDRVGGGGGVSAALLLVLVSALAHSRKHGFSIAKAGGKGFLRSVCFWAFSRGSLPVGSSGLPFSTCRGLGGVVAWTASGVLKKKKKKKGGGRQKGKRW